MSEVIRPYGAPYYTQFRNAVIDHVMPGLPSSAWKVLTVMIRQTWGFHKEVDRLSQSQLMAKTGLAENTVKRALEILIEGGHVIVVDEATPRRARAYTLNIEFELRVSISDTQGINSGSSGGPDLIPQKISSKDIPQKRGAQFTQIYEEVMGVLVGSRQAAEEMMAWEEDITEWEFRFACQTALDQGVRSWLYVKAILDRRRKDGESEQPTQEGRLTAAARAAERQAADG